MFKEKSSKKKITTDINETVTLDAMHNNMIKDFERSDKEKIYYIKKLNYCEEKKSEILRQINSTTNKEINSKLWFSNIELNEEIIDIKGKLNELNNLDEIEYYKHTSDILFQYYDTVNKQSDINQNINFIKETCNKPKTYKKDSKKKRNNNINYNTKNVLEALNNIDSKNTLIENKSIISDKCEINENEKSDSDNDNNSKICDKSTLVDKYMAIINNRYVRTVEEENIEICKICKNNMTCLQYDAIIPDDIFEKILTEIKKEKITDLKKITYLKMRDILKRLRINKYYEHINYIINRINGIPTPQFSPELEDKLCNMFRSIQAPFLKHCPKDRKNFLSYSYVLYKFFQILGLNEYLKYFPLLKSREKLYIQDQIWKKICIDLNYEIIPSL